MSKAKRPIGIEPDLAVPENFNDPLPEDMLKEWEGGQADRLELHYYQKRNQVKHDSPPTTLEDVVAAATGARLRRPWRACHAGAGTHRR